MNENGIWCQNGIPFLAPYSAKTEPVLAPYSAKTELRFWHHMVPHGASWCQKVPKRGTQKLGTRVLRFKKPNPISLKSPRFKTRFVGFLTCFATIDNSLIPQMHFYSKTNFFLLLFSAGRFKRKAT